MSDLVQIEMTLDEARETDRLIKRHINTTRYLLLDMRDRKGWKALGYESFVEYGEKELSLGAARIYQLADAGEISLQIGFSTLVENQPKETHLRPLKSVPEDERNLPPDQASYLRGKRYNAEKQAVGGDRGNQYLASSQNDNLPKNHERLAEEHKVSPATITRDGQYAAAPAQKFKIRTLIRNQKSR